MFPLPRLSLLPFDCLVNVFEGLVFAALTNASKKTCVCAWVIFRLGRSLAFAIINPLCKGDGQAYSLKIFLVVDTAVHFIFICALRHLGLIGNKGSAFLVVRSLLLLGVRCPFLLQDSAMPVDKYSKPYPGESTYSYDYRDDDEDNF